MESINSFYCKKCEEIPIIEIFPQKDEFKILATCRCHRQLLKKEIFFKNYFKENLNYDKISNAKNKKDPDDNSKLKINKIIENFYIEKEKYEKQCLEIKDKAINSLKKIIRNIESIYEKYNDNNKKINNIIEILFNSYKLCPNNDINKKNIILNTKVNIPFGENINYQDLSKFENSIIKYFNSNCIIKSNHLKLIESYLDSNKDKLMIEIKDEIFATKYMEKNIKIFKYKKNDEYIVINQDKKIKNLLTDENNKYLISIDEGNYFKFFDINELIKNKLESHINNKIIDLFPLYQFKHDTSILELINIENYLLCGKDDKNIFIYEYNVIDQTSKLVNKIGIDLKNIKLIKGKKEKYICCQDNFNFYLVSIPDLIPIEKIKIQFSNIAYDQINKDEIIICDNCNLKILNINNFTFKILKKNILLNNFYLK